MAVKKSNRRGQSAGKTSDRISIIPEKLGYYLTGFTDGEGSFNVFCRIAWIVEDKKHLEKEGIREILKLRDSIKVSRKRKYSKREILKSY